MDEESKKQRAEKLGFRPQKENPYSLLLPYSHHLDNESEKLFIAIKTNLVKSVLAREMRPGCALWTSRLNKYIKIYGLKFSKEDHIALIKLFYELMTIPDLEPTRINKCAFTLSLLLKKKYLISRDELQLEWRPLYDLIVRTIEKSKSEIGMYRYFTAFEATLYNAVRNCKLYFPASSTKEILDEFRPCLCPLNSTKIASAVQYLELFLPTAVKPEEAPIGYNLWLSEFMHLWNVCNNAGVWENNMMWIFSSLARYQMGYIDWEPYVPSIFVRFQRCLQLPVNFKSRMLGKHFRIDSSAMAIWIVCTLHTDNSTFFHLEKMLQTLESYFHAANMGRWTVKLRELLKKLAYFFVQRIHWERFKTASWDNNVPDHFKLTDDDIDRFVNIMKPCLEPAMFWRTGGQDISFALSYLASIRPNLIIPVILESLYSSMDRLTEPHKLTSSIVAAVAVGRHLVQGNHNNYPEGPTHVIPLLTSLLPGIDPNDLRKSYLTLNLIIHFVYMIPLIDSSDAHNYYDNLTEEEHMICEATAGFEDFVLQLFERLFIWIESSSLDFVRLEQITSMNTNTKNRVESFSETILGAVVNVILNQSSPTIFRSVLKKFFNFASQRVLEVQIAGKMVAVIAHKFAIVNPRETLKLFLPYLFGEVEEAFKENPNLPQEEHVDANFLYNLLLLSEVLDGQSELLLYLEPLTSILDKTLHMTCLEANQISARILEHILGSLTFIKPIENRSSTKDYGASVQEFLSIREWAKPVDISDVDIKWYVPKKQEIDAVQMLVHKYLIPELDILNRYASDEVKLTRQQLKCSLKIIVSILYCHLLLPIWEEPTYELSDSVLDSWTFNLMVIENGAIYMPDGSNIRKTVVDMLHRLQKKILSSDEGDTQSIQQVINLYNIIVFNKARNQDFEVHYKTFQLAKKISEDLLHRKKQHLRHMHLERTTLEQEFRIECRSCSFTPTHKQILEDLFELSTSRYSEVRQASQTKLFGMIQFFPYCYTLLGPMIKEILQMDSVENHEKFKGCLYILLGPKIAPIVARHDWNFVREIWPLIVKSMPSEKPSIVNLITALSESIQKFFPTIAIKLVIPERTLSAAYHLANTAPFECDLSTFQKYVDNGEEYLKSKSMERKQAYEDIMRSLLAACEKGNLHWRYNFMAISLMKILVHFDVKYNVDIVRFFLRATLNESLKIRKVAMKVLVYIMVQNRCKFKKIEIDPFKISNTIRPEHIIPGERPDNSWLIFEPKSLPKTAEQWEEIPFIHDQVVGYYSWPKKLEAHLPPSQQTSVASRLNNMTDIESEIYNFFRNEENIAQLIKYLTLEEKKGNDQFNAYRFMVFKHIFKMFEDLLLPVFLQHVDKLAKDKHESNQRCAAEIISALMRGSKHWRFEKVQKMWTTLIPILNSAIVNMSNETLLDWTLCISMALESRDSRLTPWLIDFLMHDALKDPTSFVACNRVHIITVAIGHQTWRNAHICNMILDYFKPQLSHPFQNIREKISGLLSNLFEKDLKFPGGNETSGPKTEEFFKEMTPKLQLLYKCILGKNGLNVAVDLTEACDKLSLIDIDNVKEDALRLYKIVARYIILSIGKVNFSARPEFFKLIPLAAVLHNYEQDEETSVFSINLLVSLAQTTTVKRYIPDAIEAITEVIQCPLWSARCVIPEFLKVFVFYNMAIINSNKEWVSQIQNFVTQLLEDSQPEVRLEASKVLSGLLHCQFIPQPLELLTSFKQKAKTKVKVKQTEKSITNLVIRHAGVLGLCSFINAHPYDVPEYLPEIFEALGAHLSDPEPIPTTIRKTMGDFKRTHHDNWEMHKLKFTEEELLVLSDLSVPPSYCV